MDPKFPRPPGLEEAQRLFQRGDIRAARNQLENLLERQAESPQALILMSAIQHRLGKGNEAIAWLQRAAAVSAHDADLQLQIAGALQRVGAVAEAATLLDRLDPVSSGVFAARAQNCWRAGDYDAALLGFREAVHRWPEDAAHHARLARALIRFGHLDEVAGILERAIARFAGDRELVRLRALCLLDQGLPKAALETLERHTPGYGDGAELKALRETLRIVLGLEPGRPLPNPQDLAREGFAWVMDKTPAPSWFGTGTGLLRWSAAQAKPEGTFVECGVYHGFTLSLLAEWTGRQVHGFDSFQGLPEDWHPGEPAGSYSTAGRLPALPANAQLHPGWFRDTLPAFAAALNQPIALLHVDCDLYTSTHTVLDELGPHLVPGSLLVFDDFLGYPGYQQHEFRAAQEYFARDAREFSLVGAVLLGRSVTYRVS